MAALLSLSQPPDAVFVANNLMTIGALACLTDSGVAIGEQVGIVGFDDIPWAPLMRPSLSVVTQPTYEVGRAAGQLLSQRIADPERPPSSVLLSTTLSVRNSSVRTPVIEPQNHRLPRHEPSTLGGGSRPSAG
jgi:LacI family transcriptional regulator